MRPTFSRQTDAPPQPRRVGNSDQQQCHWAKWPILSVTSPSSNHPIPSIPPATLEKKSQTPTPVFDAVIHPSSPLSTCTPNHSSYFVCLHHRHLLTNLTLPFTASRSFDQGLRLPSAAIRRSLSLLQGQLHVACRCNLPTAKPHLSFPPVCRIHQPARRSPCDGFAQCATVGAVSRHRFKWHSGRATLATCSFGAASTCSPHKCKHPWNSPPSPFPSMLLIV